MKKVMITDLVWFQEGPGVRKNQYTELGVKLLNVSNLVEGEIVLENSSRYISNEEAYGKYNHFLCDEGDLIIASSGIKVEYLDEKMGFVKKEMLPLCMNTSTIRFKSISDNLNIRYFMYYLKSNLYKKQIQKLITGSAQLNYGPSHLKKVYINLHSNKRQIAIVKALDLLNEIKNTLNKRLNQYDKLVKSQFIEMFGDIKESINLSYISELITKGASPKWQGVNYVDDDTKTLFITSENVLSNKIDLTKSKYLEDKINNIQPRSILKKNDILINIVGASIGRAAVYKKEYVANINQAVCLVRLKEGEINRIYLSSYLNSEEALKYYSQNQSDVARANLSLKNIAEMPIPYPPISLQNRFAKFVELVDKLKFNIEEQIKETQTLLDSYMQKYFG